MRLRRSTWFFMCALVACIVSLHWHNAPTRSLPVALAPFVTTTSPTTPAVFVQNILPMPPNMPSAHAATAAALPDGSVLAIWFAGSREGGTDVQLWQSHYHKQQWSPAQPIINPRQTGQALLRYVKKIGNPSLVLGLDGRLHLFYVSVSLGGWAGSALNEVVSTDLGQHWSAPRRLIASPFMNLSTLVRSPPLVLRDGSLALPAYHELIRKYPQWLFVKDGAVLNSIHIPNAAALLQPSPVALSSGKILTWLRDSGSDGHVWFSQTMDTGDWSAPRPTNLPNPNAAVAALRLDDGNYLLAYNPQQMNRNVLALARSQDGMRWHQIAIVAQSNNPQEEFSYPTLIAANGRIHLFYTWKRQTIAHAEFNLGWLTHQECRP